MKLGNSAKLLNLENEIPDLIENSYVVTVYNDSVAIQGNFKGGIIKKYLGPANLSINPDYGYVEGSINVNGITVSLTFTE